MRKIYLLLFYLLCCGAASAQCNNSIQVKKAIKADANNGVLEIAIATAKEFKCVLSIEKGSGPEPVSEKRGRGNQTLKFESINPNLIYQVQVEFVGEENSYCRKLQKSQIILE